MVEYLLKSRQDLIKEIETLKKRIHSLSEEKENETNNRSQNSNGNNIVDLLQQTVFETDEAGKIIYANEYAFNMFGYTKEDLLNGVYAVDFLAPEDIQRAVLSISGVMNGQTIENKEYIAIRKDGARFPILIHSTPIYKDSRICGIRGFIVDLTSQKQQDNKLALMSTVIEKLSQPIFWIDETGTIIYLNSTACEMIGETPSSIKGKKAWTYNSKITPELWKSFWEELKVKNRIIDITKMTDKDGKEIIIENRSNYIKAHNIEFSFTYTVDITTRVKAEEDLRKISKAIEQSSHSVIVTDKKGKIEYINPNFVQVTGYQPEEIIGKMLNILKPGYAPEEIYNEVWGALNSGNEWKGEFLNKRKNKETFWESVLITPVKNTKGEVTNFLALKEDINKKKEMEMELKWALDRAEESSRLKSSLLANMNHEIRTPLTGILGMAQILNEELSNSFLLQFAQNILISGKRLMTTLNAILDLSELESDNTQMSINEFYLGSQLKYSLGYYIDLAEKKNLYFRFILNDENIAAYTDQKLCNQILMNIVDNAVKYTNKGGITISVEPVKEENDLWLKISISDTGIGISPENQEMIFEEFRQISEGLNRSFEGTGLGLAIVKKMVNLLGGRIEVKSVVGLGSEFIVYFPAVSTLNREEEETVEVLTENQAAALSSDLPSILLVEDNEINTAVVLNFLNKNCIIDHADTGEKAIEMAARNTYEIILMDINLGAGIDGVEAAKEIREIDGYEKIPIVAVTGYATSSEKKKFLSQGLDYHIAKPFTKDDLIELINKILTVEPVILEKD